MHLLLFQHMKRWQLWLISVVLLSVLLSEVIEVGVELLLKGEVSLDFLFAGLMVSLFLSSLIVAMLSYFFEELRESHLQVQAILDAIPDSLFEIDDQGYFYKCHSPHKNLPINPEQFLGKTVAEALPPDAAKVVMSALAETQQQGWSSGKQFKLALPLRDCWIEVSVSMKYAEAGQQPHFIVLLHDISNRKQIEGELNISEARFRAIVELSPVPMVLNDKQQNITFLSPAFVKTFGYDLTDIPTVSDWYVKAYPDPEYRQKININWNAMLQQIEANSSAFPDMEVQVCCKDGTLKDVLISVAITSCDAEDRYLISLYDITERKQHEYELTNNKRFNALIESIPDAIFFKDGMGRWLITNESAKQLFHLHGIPWQGKTEMEIAALHPEFYAAHEKCFEDDEKAWATGQLALFSETIITADNQKRDFEVRKVPLFDVLGQRQAMVIIGRDVTEQKNTLKQLNQLALAVEQSPESIVITNLEGQIEYVNSSFSQTTGYSRSEILHKKISILKSNKTSEETYLNLWKALDQGQSWQGEFINRRKDGTEYIEFAIIAPLRDSSGVITHYVSVKENITEKKRLANELEQYRNHLEDIVEQRTKELMVAKAQAEKANQAKSEFLANMSHEIRTPMNAILGFSEILTHLITDPIQRHHLDAIHRSGKTLLQLINDVLDLSKIEAGKFTLQYAPVSIHSLLEDIEVIFSQKAAHKSLEFSIVIDERLPKTLLLDETRLRQILLNLVGNALKFTNDGFVSLAVTANFNTATEKLDLMIAIYDTGIGISETEKDKIFSAFTQQDNQGTEYGGTGLGLTISKRLLELMGGNISVESEVGKGSCFTLILKDVEVVDNDSKIVSESLPTVKAIHFQPARILLVDDLPLNRLLITSFLAEFSELTIIEAETGQQALNLTEQQHFDLIFMDRRLPDMEGDTVCQKIKSLAGHANIPIIMVSASVIATPESQHTLFYEMQLNKPVCKRKLLAAMQTFLPLDENTEITLLPRPVETAKKAIAETVDAEKLQELVEMLKSNYQERIKQLSLSGGFEIDAIIEIAEELLDSTDQYPCGLLEDWANTLKSQARLFDITHLARTLKEFEKLVKALSEPKLSGFLG
jgi:PAS domain S-box-containing protein